MVCLLENQVVKKSIWGILPSEQKYNYAFDNQETNRKLQDVGLDGLNDEKEKQFFPHFKNEKDPSSDNYQFYKGFQHDRENASYFNAL